ncbi:MAG: phytase [Cellvibrionaceae bacterium]|nr:phytase [Cellvibrionaceae bacterium]
MRALGQILVCLISLSVLANEDALQATKNTDLLLAADFSANDIAAVNQAEGYWLVSSGKSGILKVAADRQVATLFSGRYELIDSVRINQQDLIASFNLNSDTVDIIYGDRQYPLKKPAFNVDDLCLFRDRQNHVFVYMVDGYGGVDQRWIYEGSQRQFIDIPVHTLPTAPGMEVCAVNSVTQTLYLLEQELGLWQYPAAAETTPFRHLLLHSENPASYQGLAVIDSELFVAEADKIRHYTLSASGDAKHSLQLQQSWYVGDAREPQALAFINHSPTSKLAYLDDASSAVYVIEFTPSAGGSTNDGREPKKVLYPEVRALAETYPMDRRGDTADDPAIWLNQSRPQRSVILATNKRFGLMVYDLKGQLLQSLAVGRVNNVDIRQNNLLAGQTLDIAVASNRSDNSLQFFTIDKKGRVSEAGRIATGLDDVYGVCLYRESPQSLFAFINDKDGRVQQYRLSLAGKRLRGELVSRFKLASQPEACVVDDRRKQVFIGEEDRGVWRYHMDAQGIIDEKTAKLIAKVGEVLVDDVEGLALYIKENRRYLLVSSQGDNSYAVYQAEQPYTYVGSFRVGLNSELGIDGTAQTDGLAVSSAFFSQDFVSGLLVIQDGFNLMPAQAQNFKLIPWEGVAKILKE